MRKQKTFSTGKPLQVQPFPMLAVNSHSPPDHGPDRYDHENIQAGHAQDNRDGGSRLARAAREDRAVRDRGWHEFERVHCGHAHQSNDAPSGAAPNTCTPAARAEPQNHAGTCANRSRTTNASASAYSAKPPVGQCFARTDDSQFSLDRGHAAAAITGDWRIAPHRQFHQSVRPRHKCWHADRRDAARPMPKTFYESAGRRSHHPSPCSR